MSEQKELTFYSYSFRAKRAVEGGYWINSAGRWDDVRQAAKKAGEWLSAQADKSEFWTVEVCGIEELELLP